MTKAFAEDDDDVNYVVRKLHRANHKWGLTINLAQNYLIICLLEEWDTPQVKFLVTRSVDAYKYNSIGRG